MKRYGLSPKKKFVIYDTPYIVAGIPTYVRSMELKIKGFY